MQPEPAQTQQEYDARGVDLTLIRWMLDMTPAERLAALQSFVDAVWKAREARGAVAPPSFRSVVQESRRQK
jgi:hypothetical protein